MMLRPRKEFVEEVPDKRKEQILDRNTSIPVFFIIENYFVYSFSCFPTLQCIAYIVYFHLMARQNTTKPYLTPSLHFTELSWECLVLASFRNGLAPLPIQVEIAMDVPRFQTT